MLTVLLTALCLAGVLVALFGAWVLVMLGKSLREPADTSNRINRVRLLWFVLTRPELFVDAFPWLKRDEQDNVKGTP
jgi:hypothetical protein